MIGPKVIRETENYRVIERIGKPGEYLLQKKTGCWRAYGEYRRAGSAIKKMEQLEQNIKEWRNQK